MLKITKRVLQYFGLFTLFTSSALAVNSDFNFSVTPVADNVYSIISPSYGRPSAENKGWNSNSHFVVTKSGVLVFDTGSSEIIGKGIIKAIKSVTEQPIRWVVNSHSHADHWLGNAAFLNIGAKIIATASSTSAMKEDGQGVVDAFERMTEGATGNSSIAYPTTLLTKREKRMFGEVEVEFIFANDGHSPGDVLMWLPKQKIILGGDVVNSDWIPIMTPRGNVPHLIDTLNAIIKLDPAIVLTGHGKGTTVQSVIRDVNLLSSVWKLVENGNKEGKSVDNILSQVTAELAGKYSSLYKDFDSSSSYLVQMMYKKQQ